MGMRTILSYFIFQNARSLRAPFRPSFDGSRSWLKSPARRLEPMSSPRLETDLVDGEAVENIKKHYNDQRKSLEASSFSSILRAVRGTGGPD